METLFAVDDDGGNGFVFKVVETILLTLVVLVLVGLFKGVSIGKVSILLVNWLVGEFAETETGGSLLSGEEVAVEVELALNPLSANLDTPLECEDGLRATTVCN